MNIEVYCDESCPETLKDKPSHKYLLLGSLWLPSSFRSKLKQDIKVLRAVHNYHLEIKWNKVSPKYLEFYKALVSHFFCSQDLRFRALVVESAQIDLVKFHSDDAELSFYKFYYEMLHHWILDFNEYQFFLDYKTNKIRFRLPILKRVLSNASLSSSVLNVQSIHSGESIGIQYCDFLLGAVNAKFNNSVASDSAKAEIIRHIEYGLSREIGPTPKSMDKFNIFRILLQGGW
ncbi:MAG: DUF3800 domain-containing protein [Ignavibacteria bacterium]|nr:DUF3800 domain-containing protein [Ignavibacteria bacterium]